MLGPADFLGEWRVDRRIDDRLGPGGVFEGRATFTPDAEGLRYDEAGTLRLGDAPPLAASRAYLWRWGDGVEVSFPDGRPFHRFVPEGAAAGTDHPCGPDLYRVAYDFTAWPAWGVAYEVTGPRKAYRARAALTRP